MNEEDAKQMLNRNNNFGQKFAYFSWSTLELKLTSTARNVKTTKWTHKQKKATHFIGERRTLALNKSKNAKIENDLTFLSFVEKTEKMIRTIVSTLMIHLLDDVLLLLALQNLQQRFNDETFTNFGRKLVTLLWEFSIFIYAR